MVDANNTQAGDAQFAIDTIEEAAAKWLEIDALMTNAWMKFPDKIRKRLNEVGAATDFDALARANRLREVAQKARDLTTSKV